MLEYGYIRHCALSVGFDDCGIAVAHRQDEDAVYMEEWLAQGLCGDMHYLERNREKRYNPQELVPGAKYVVVCVLHYNKCKHDYHRKIKSMLYQLEAAIHSSSDTKPSLQHIFCDSAPFLERRWAVEAGMGFIGRNRQFYHYQIGSMVHLGELVLCEEVNNLPAPHIFDGCPKDCTLCMAACPTGALRTSVWDARECVAYTTYRCTICQEACPLNKT